MQRANAARTGDVRDLGARGGEGGWLVQCNAGWARVEGEERPGEGAEPEAASYRSWRHHRARKLFREAMDIWLRELPAIPLLQWYHRARQLFPRLGRGVR